MLVVLSNFEKLMSATSKIYSALDDTQMWSEEHQQAIRTFGVSYLQLFEKHTSYSHSRK